MIVFLTDDDDNEDDGDDGDDDGDYCDNDGWWCIVIFMTKAFTIPRTCNEQHKLIIRGT